MLSSKEWLFARPGHEAPKRPLGCKHNLLIEHLSDTVAIREDFLGMCTDAACEVLAAHIDEWFRFGTVKFAVNYQYDASVFRCSSTMDMLVLELGAKTRIDDSHALQDIVSDPYGFSCELLASVRDKVHRLGYDVEGISDRAFRVTWLDDDYERARDEFEFASQVDAMDHGVPVEDILA